ncbi:MAG: hypothetical protein FJ297_11880 [Planctomycetes bacterium]|nr:hypothetical protein [Planctomycetota bacterium]
MVRPGPLVAALSLALLPCAARGQPMPSGDREAECRQWVERLGSPSYTERETAAKRIADLGVDAVPILSESMNHKDLEIRLRVRELLDRATRSDLERRLAAFVADDDPDPEIPFPGWKPFQAVLGHDQHARQLFVEMLRLESELLGSFERSAEERAALLSNRAQFLQSLASNAVQGPAFVHPASVGALLLVGAETPNAGGVVSSRLYIMLINGQYKPVLLSGSRGTLLKKLLERWVTARVDTAQDDFGLQLALAYDLDATALVAARRLLDAPAGSTRGIPHAAIAVGRFGNRADDFERLRRHVGNKSVCHTWSNPQLKKDGVIEIQIRDVVLVILLRLTEQDPKPYGFDLLQANPATLYHIYTFGFLDNEPREAAHAKWEAWCRASGIPE